MATKTKKSVLAEIIISLVFGLIFGGLLLFLSTLGAATIIKWVLIVTGIIIVITNIAPLIRGIVNIKEKGGVFDVIVSAIAIALGIVMIVYQNAIISTIITVLLAVYLIVLPIIRIVIAPSKKEQLSKEWLRILIGAILIVFLPAILGAADTIVNILLMIAGIVIIVLTDISFILSLIAYIKASKKAEEEAPIETVAEEAPVEEAPVEEAPVEEAPVEEAPVEEVPVEEAPVEEAPVEEAPVEEAPVEEAPVDETPAEETTEEAAE